MLEVFKPYLHRVGERQKSSRPGRRNTVYTIFTNPNAMRLSWRNIDNDSGDLVIAWQETVAVKAFKRDLYSADLICIAFLSMDNRTVEIDEEMGGWESLVEKLHEYLPGCQKFEEWFSVVAFPTFKPNTTAIYQRKDNSRPTSELLLF